MASIDFNLFKILWKKVEEKFVKNGEPFTFENLNSRGVSLRKVDWDKINSKLEQDETPKDINLSESARKALYKYMGIERLTDLDIISEEIKRNDNKSGAANIVFLGRKDELNELNDFLANPELRILELYGLPMIGKTELINYFLDKNQIAQNYKSVRVRLNPQPDDPELKLSNIVFEGRDFNDFSDYSSNTLIVLQNFEEILRWIGHPKELHNIQDKYSKIRAFLKEVINVDTIKLIIESRFKINFRSILSNVTPWPIESLEIKGVKREEFWKFYRSKKFSRAQFERLCNNFNDHTGLLTLAYNDDFIYGDLIDAVYRPKDATVYLWEHVGDIVERLEGREILSLCALTLLKEPTTLENLYSYLISPGAFQDELEVDDSLRSLEKKLLIQVKGVLYELNPYVREVCFTFLTKTRKREMQVISQLPYFKVHGEEPIYNPIRQAQDRGDYMYLFRLGKELREAGKYDDALEVIEAGLPINPQPKYVLNEKAICYRDSGQLDKAIEIWNTLKTDYKHLPAFRELAAYYRENKQTKRAIEILEEARKVDPNDVITLTELAISYSDNKDYEKSIASAKKAINLGDNYCYIVLANTYQRMDDLEKAYQTAQSGVEATNRKDHRLIEKLHELEKLVDQPPKTISKSNPLKVFISYSHRDEEIKERIDVFLATLKREGKIETWNDRRIPAGDKWDNTIKTELEVADIILLLISQDFIKSEYIWDVELPRALERHERGEAVVVPIFGRAIDDFKEMPFAKLNGLPKNAEPINSSDNDNALAEVARGIRKIVVKLLEERSH
ncbi:MAG TPA: TIR domain-containing protein [Pyrinomonadaceae bacterium]|jgi:tetratricopeptide (TPR) repeat protein